MIFYQVERVYRGKSRIAYEGDNLARANAEYEKIKRAIRNGLVCLRADGSPRRRCSVWNNRTRW